MNGKTSSTIKIGIPSKGRMGEETIEFLKKCGLEVKRTRRNYFASIPAYPDIKVVLQRQEDIVKGVTSGLLEMGIIGFDLYTEILNSEEKRQTIVLFDDLEFGKCDLAIAVPEEWEISDITEFDRSKGYRVATKFTNTTQEFLDTQNIAFQFVEGAGTLEISPALGNADFIVDLVSTGQTLKDNRLKQINNGKILSSQAIFVGNRTILKSTPEALHIASDLIEIFAATLRAEKFVSVFVNMRGNNRQEIIDQFFTVDGLEGLQGPTVSDVYTKDNGDWFAVHLVVAKRNLLTAIKNIRQLGGSGVVVSETNYIFEEEPKQYTLLKEQLRGE